MRTLQDAVPIRPRLPGGNALEITAVAGRRGRRARHFLQVVTVLIAIVVLRVFVGIYSATFVVLVVPSLDVPPLRYY